MEITYKQQQKNHLQNHSGISQGIRETRDVF